MSTKKKTTTQSVNSLPSWLTSPYQAATQQATQLAQQPAISAGTQGSIDAIRSSAASGANVANQAIGTLSGMAGGNFGNTALTQAANGSFLSSGPFAQNGGLDTGYIDGSGLNATANGTGGLNPFVNSGNPITVSSALSGFQANGGLDRGYIDQSVLNGFANGTSGVNGFANNGGRLDTGYINDSLLNRTAAGDFLTADSNPYIRGVAQQGADRAQAAINAQFGAAGRSNGSGLYAQLFGQGISDAANSVYAQNYANERQLQQGAQNTLLGANQSAREAALAREYGATESNLGRQQSAANTLLGAEQSAREAALARQYGAAGSVFGAENSAAENAAQRAYGATEANLGRQQSAQGTLLSAQQGAREAALTRQAQSYEAERARQQAAASGLLSSQLSASSQIPGLLSAIMSGNGQALAAGQYQDEAEMLKAARQAGLLSTLSQPFGINNGTATEKTSGLGNAIGVYAGLMNSFANRAAAAGG